MNNEEIVARVQANLKFQELVQKMLSIVMLAIYYGFILVLAFNPSGLGASLSGGITTVGIPVGLGVIISAFVLTGVYVQRANGEFDRLTQEVVEEARK